MLRVLHLCASDLRTVSVGGIASYVRELLKHSHLKVQHSCVGVTKEGRAALGKWGEVSFESCKASFFPVLAVDKTHVTYEKGIPLNARFLWALFCFRGRIQNLADVLHFHRVELALPFVLFPKKGVQIVVTIHGAAKHHDLATNHALFSKGWFNTLYLGVEAFVLKRVDRVILVNAEGVEHYTRKFPLIRDKFKFFPTFVDFSLFCAMDSKACRERFNLPVAMETFLFVGRLHEQKGLDLLFDAFILLKKKGRSCFLVIGGSGGEESRLREKVKLAGLESSVRFLGHVTHDQLPYIFNAADAYVLPSLWEGMPIALLEALSCGTPAVATDVGQVSAVLKDGVNGYLVRHRDPAEMAAAMVRVITDGVSLRSKCSASVAAFASDKVIADIERYYEGVA